MGSQAYNQKNVKQVKLALNLKTDADIIRYLATIPNMQGYIKTLIREDMTKGVKTMKISFEAGEGRNFSGAVNYMKSQDGTIYAEIAVPEGASEDYGYLTMKQAILDNYTGTKAPVFWYDGQEQHLEPDASADAKVYLEIED